MRLPTPRIFQAHKRPLLFAAALLLLVSAQLPAQFFGAALEIHYVTADLTGACVARFITVNTLTANVRGCINSVWTDLVAGGGGGLGVAFNTVAYSATPAYTVTASTSIQTFKITLTGNITSATLTTTNATVGQTIIFQACQDATGSRTIAWPANVLNYGTLDPTASSCSKQAFVWDGTNAVASSVMYSDAATPALLVSAGALILPQAPDTMLAAGSIDTDTALTANSDAKLASQKAVKAYIDGRPGTALTRIGQVITTGSATSVSFSSIPNTSTNLLVEFDARTTAATVTTGLRLAINGDSSSFSSTQYVLTSDTSTSSAKVSVSGGAYITNVTGASVVTGASTAGTIRFRSYSRTTFRHRFDALSTFSNLTDPDIKMNSSGTWTSTAAINQLTFALDSGNAFLDGSIFTLYAEQ